MCRKAKEAYNFRLKGEPVLRRKAQRNQENDVLIKRFGNDILKSEEFEAALTQTHHHRSSVGDHSIMTARAGLTMCNLMKKAGVHIDQGGPDFPVT